ncbi:MAG: hypothetical protein HOP13_13905 [Alphaproteobacteria bacterium]|nr:hypothetical protein [Alphaproteobacteria bacterium]
MRLSRHRIGLFAAALLSLTSLAAHAADRPPIKTVGIVADTGDKVNMRHIGFMVFSNKDTAHAVPDWAIDAHIANTLSEGLKARYELKPVTFQQRSIAPALDNPFDNPDVEDTMRTNAKPADGQPLDAYVVVWPMRQGVAGTNQFVEGVGLLTQGGRANFFLALRVSLLDGRTFEEIEGCSARIRDRSFWNPEKSTMNEAQGFEDVETFDAMTPEQKQTMQATLKQMLTGGMNYCLQDLKLVE